MGRKSNNRRRQKWRSRARTREPAYHTITRFVVNDVVKGSGSADRGLYRSVTLNGATKNDIENLYQEFRILKVTLIYQLYTQPNNNANFPSLFIAPQQIIDNGAVPLSRDEVCQFRGAKVFQFGPNALTYRATFKPKVFAVATGGVRGAVWTSPWLSVVGGDAANHMLCVEWISNYNAGTDNSHTIRLSTVYTVQARFTR